MAKDRSALLEGNITKQLLVLTGPLFIGNMLQQLYNTADSLIVGAYLGTEAFASTGVSGTLMNLFIFVLNGFCVGASVIFGQLYGADKKDEFRKTVFTALAFGSLFTFALSGIFIAVMRPLLRLISTPDELMGYCSRYLGIILAGLIFTYLYNLFSNLLRSLGDTKSSLVFLIISVTGNVFMDWLFIHIFNLGIGGAAFATILAQGFSALCCYIYVRKRYVELFFRREDAGIYGGIISKIFSFGLVSAMHSSSLYLGKILVQGVVNSLGTSVIAAFTATTRIEAFINSAGDSASQAMTIHISQNYGAGNCRRVKQTFRTAAVMFTAFSAVCSVLMYFAAPACLSLFLDGSDPVAMSEGTAYLKLIFFFYIFSYFGYIFAANARGLGLMTIPFAATSIHLSIRVILSYILAGRMGLTAVAWATGIGWMANTVFNIIMYMRIYGTGLFKGKKPMVKTEQEYRNG